MKNSNLNKKRRRDTNNPQNNNIVQNINTGESAKSKEIEKLKKKISQLKNELKEKNETIQTNNETIQTLQIENNEKDEKIQTLKIEKKNALKEKDETIQTLQIENEKLKNNLSAEEISNEFILKDTYEQYQLNYYKIKNKKNDDDNINGIKIAEYIINEINKINTESDGANEDEYTKKYKNLENYAFKFGDEICNDKLKDYIKNAVEYVNCRCNKNEKKAIKNFFLKVKDYILDNFSKKGIRDKVMRDMLITYFFKKKFVKFEVVDSLFLFKNVSNIPLYKIQVENIILNKDFLKNAIKKKIIINNYLKVCEKYINYFDTEKYTVNKISNILKSHINKMNIYFAELDNHICGFTIYTGDIVINGRYLNGIYSESSKFKFECLACIFLTILHELAHCLTRILKRKNNYFQNQFSRSIDINNDTIKQIKIKSVEYNISKENEVTNNFNNIIEELNNLFEEKNLDTDDDNKINESGNYFDLNMFYNKYYKEITKDEAMFFLNLKNYDVEEKDYKINLTNLYYKRNENKESYCLKSTNENYKILSIGKCARDFRNGI